MLPAGRIDWLSRENKKKNPLRAFYISGTRNLLRNRFQIGTFDAFLVLFAPRLGSGGRYWAVRSRVYFFQTNHTHEEGEVLGPTDYVAEGRKVGHKEAHRLNI